MSANAGFHVVMFADKYYTLSDEEFEKVTKKGVSESELSNIFSNAKQIAQPVTVKSDTNVMTGAYNAGSVGSKEIQTQKSDGVIEITATGRDFSVAPKTHTLGMDVNPDAGAGSGAVVTTSTKTTVTLSDIPPEIRTQSPFKELLGPGDAQGNYEVKQENWEKLKLAIERYYNIPNNLAISGDDAEFNAQIKAELVKLGVYGEDGEVKDPQKLLDVVKNGITVNGKKYTFTPQEGEPVSVPVTTTSKTEVSSKFKEMDPNYVKKIKPEQLKELEKQGYITKVGDTYYTTQESLQLRGATEIGKAKSSIAPESLVGNKALQDVRERELQQDFLKAYDTDPDNAFDALLHTKYYKEYKKLEDALITLNGKDNSVAKDKNYANEVEYRRKGVLARTYFAQSKNTKGETVFEYATKEDIEKFQKSVAAKKAELAKLTPQERIDRYKTSFGDVNSANIGDLSDVQLLELAENEVYASGLSDSQVKHMASVQFKNRFNTQMNNVYNEYQDKIAEANAKGKTKKAARLKEELETKLREISQQKIETENQDRSDYANMMSRGQLNSEIGEGNFKKTNPTYASIIAQVPQAEKFIQSNKALFFTKDASGQEVFNAQAWKDFWLAQSSSRRDNTIEVQNTPVKDYYMTLGEAENVEKGNANGRAGERFVGLEALYGGMSKNERINLARDMAESAGIVTEKNNTAGIRTAYVLGEVAKGAGIAAASDILANAVISKIKIPYFGTVMGTVTGTVNGTVSGTVPFAKSGTIQDLDTFVTEQYSNGFLVNRIETEVLEEHQWFVNEDVAYSQDYSAKYSKDYQKDYSGEKKIGDFHVDPWMIGIGGVAGLVKGLIGKNKKHDKQDGKSEIQMYARDNYDRRTTSTPELSETVLEPIKTKKFVATLAESTPKQEDIPNIKHKMLVKRGGVETTGPNKGKPYNLAEDKEDYVSKLYNVPKGSPEFAKLYKYIMETINGVTQYKAHQYKNDKTYFFPEKLPKELTGLDKDYDAGAEPEKTFIKIYLANNVRTNINGKETRLQGASGRDVHATVVASHKKKKV